METFTKLKVNKDTAASLLLFAGVVAALLFSNNYYYLKHYRAFTNQELYIGFGSYQINKTLLKWVNDGLMALFFFLLGLEMKYHIIQGEFQNRKNLLLPIFGALGGFVVPALIYYMVNIDDPIGRKGWAIPVATDTAFVLAIVSFFGSKVSNSAKVFLIGLSIIDDVLAVSVLALFYTPSLEVSQLYMCALPLTGLLILNWFALGWRWLYYLLGIILWFFTVKSGVHGTIAGILLAFFVPVKVKSEEQEINFLKDTASMIHGFVAFFVLPLFAFVNCELPLHELSRDDLFSNISIGCILGLLVGKSIGVYGFAMAAVKCKWCNLPYATNKLLFLGISVLCGIGFTLSLFIGLQAFDTIALENQMKIGVLLSSCIAAAAGATIIKLSILKKQDL